MAKPGRKPRVTDEEFIELYKALGSRELGRRTGMKPANVQKRRIRIERRHFIALDSPDPNNNQRRVRPTEYPHRRTIEIRNGIAIVAGDAHYWPGDAPLMHRALVAFCKDMKPAAIIFNGDVIDAPQISRHPPIGWEHRPKLSDEIENAQDRLSEIEKATFKARKVWNCGNHDVRYETRLATVAPEYARIHGLHLKDHFPAWETAWAAWINNDVVVKHRIAGGTNAAYNNAVKSGKTCITGHLHSAKIAPFTDYNGTRYGVDAGCIADTDHKAFVDYTEDNPKDWRSAFCVLKFVDGKLMQPELVLKWDDKRVQFRGEVHTP